MVCNLVCIHFRLKKEMGKDGLGQEQLLNILKIKTKLMVLQDFIIH
jgi:hypothetical protein